VVGCDDQPGSGDGQTGREGMAERPVVSDEAGVMPVEGRGLGSRQTLKAKREWRLGNLATPSNLQKLQTALHAKAKAEPESRFYALYDKIYREDILAYAYACCRANKGAAGVDGQSFKEVEAYGVEKWLGELAQALREESYRPEAVRRVLIPKSNGKFRPLGIPCLRDRVCQTAAMLILEPIFEADLPPEQYAYRKGRNALDAVKAVHSLLNTGHREVVDADLLAYYDSIPHPSLMKSVARRVVDRRVLHLIKMWLIAPVEETDKRGRKKRTTPNRDSGQGTPQGSPISPLLANLYMRRFILGWKKAGLENRFGAKIVTYADDLVICCKRGAKEALSAMREIMRTVGLTVNEEKTRMCSMPDGSFDFLGYTFGRCYSTKTGRAYIGTRPSKKSVKRMIDAIHADTDRKLCWLEATEVVQRLNLRLEGWANYFCLGPVSKAYKAIDNYTIPRLRRWLCAKHKVAGGGYTLYPDEYFQEELGLIRLWKSTQNLPWAKA
jgi:RNA-directed DNA polymerase